ncbi:MAG: heme ABC transporter ATP-binding protein [Elstera sp.]
MIRADAVSLTLGGKAILEDISFTLPPGTVTAVLGANGAGKSSLLAVLAGDRAPSTGTLTWFDRPLSAWSSRDLARHRAMVPQATQLAFPFTVEEVVALGRLPHPRSDDDPAALASLRWQLDLDRFWGRAYASLSGGEQQRVQFARALAQLWYPPETAPPRVLLLDEPTAALDLKHQVAILTEARMLATRDGITVVAILHDLTLAARIADSALLLHHGRMLRHGPVAEVIDAAALSLAYDTPVSVLRHPETGRLLVSAA